ncbi:MAG: efflux RND transporter periplasmic adaptor subunit [Myxococcales bacterium]|nr:efflux RND transporter periplasmic adaptor subunit [Myxococcales bacterium]
MLQVACGEKAVETHITAPPVLVKRATAHAVVDQIEATGQLLAQAEATVAAQVEGEITSVAADEGSDVALDQVIIEIDPQRRRLELENDQASVVQAQAQLDEARREYKRLETLVGRGAVSKARVDEAMTNLDLARSGLVAAQAQLGLALRALSDASVTAPFAGLLGRRYVNVGEYVNAGQQLFHLVALDPVEVEFHLSEVDSSRVAVGQSVEIRVAPYPNEIFRAKVSVVSPTIDVTTRTRRVKAVVANPDGRLLPGTFAHVDLGVTERSGVVMIPKEAVLQRSDGSVIFRLVGSDKVERIRVEPGIHRDDLVEVRGVIGAGDWIVVRGQTGLIDGSVVSLRNEDGTEFDAAAMASTRGVSGR